MILYFRFIGSALGDILLQLVANPCFTQNVEGGTEITWFWTKFTCKVIKLPELLIKGGWGVGIDDQLREDQWST